MSSWLPKKFWPLAQAISRVYGKHGEKKMRSRARIKFLIEKLGMDKFREMVLAERQKLPHDPAWTEYLADVGQEEETPLKPPGGTAFSERGPRV